MLPVSRHRLAWKLPDERLPAPAAVSLGEDYDPVTLSYPFVTEGTSNPVFVDVRALPLAGSMRGTRGVHERSVKGTRAACRAALPVAVTWCLAGRPGCCLKCPVPMGAKNRPRSRIYLASGFLRRGLVPVHLPCTPRDLTGGVHGRCMSGQCEVHAVPSTGNPGAGAGHGWCNGPCNAPCNPELRNWRTRAVCPVTSKNLGDCSCLSVS